MTYQASSSTLLSCSLLFRCKSWASKMEASTHLHLSSLPAPWLARYCTNQSVIFLKNTCSPIGCPIIIKPNFPSLTLKTALFSHLSLDYLYVFFMIPHLSFQSLHSFWSQSLVIIEKST